jgi:hypothetical protein
VRQLIADLREASWPHAEDLKILDRLASSPIMRDVWTKLPANGASPTEVFTKVFDAARWALAQRPPFPKRGKAAQERHIKSHPPSYTLGNVAACARMLLDAMEETRPEAAALWAPGQPEIEELLKHVELIRQSYEAMQQYIDACWEEFRKTRIRTTAAANAKELIFSKILSRYFENKFGKPLDAVVAALVEAAFGCKNGVSEEKIRRLRRKY